VIFWLDAQLPPGLADWLATQYGVQAQPLRQLGLLYARDTDIFAAARAAGAVLVSKDIDFVDLVQRRGTPPQLLWVTCGNSSKGRLREVFAATFPRALRLLAEGRPIVEIADA
jgi:predicted nuclease of predicted toxin-antitoxin system